jgi:hypothetical protein
VRLNPWLATFNPESRFSGFTDIDGTVAFYLRVNALATSKDVVLDLDCGQGTYANDPVIAMPKSGSCRSGGAAGAGVKTRGWTSTSCCGKGRSNASRGT